MEESLFHLPEVSGQLKKVVEARLHTDRPSPHLDKILGLQMRFSGTPALPIYVIVDPVSEKVLGDFKGSTTDPAAFAEFVRQATL